MGDEWRLEPLDCGWIRALYWINPEVISTVLGPNGDIALKISPKYVLNNLRYVAKRQTKTDRQARKH